MTHDDNVDEIDLDDSLEITEAAFDAVCEDCGVTARFNTAGESRTVGETFETNCFACHSGRFPGLGATTRFRVGDLTPDRDTSPNTPSRPVVFLSDDSR